MASSMVRPKRAERWLFTFSRLSCSSVGNADVVLSIAKDLGHCAGAEILALRVAQGRDDTIVAQDDIWMTNSPPRPHLDEHGARLSHPRRLSRPHDMVRPAACGRRRHKALDPRLARFRHRRIDRAAGA